MVVATAESLFYVNPDNLRALAVLVHQKLIWAKATQSLDPQGPSGSAAMPLSWQSED